MINFKEFFETKNKTETLYKIDNDSCVGIYYGYDEFNNYCMALKTPHPMPFIESTKLLNIEIKEDVLPNTFWIYFSLKDKEARNLFFYFCQDIYEVINSEKDFKRLGILIKNRIICWKKMFSKIHKQLSPDILYGLFGELFFIDYFLSKKIGISDAIKAWSGPLGTSKDFTYKNVWFEIKTIGVQQQTIKISSLNQLSDLNNGYLVVIKIEKTSELYDSQWSDIMTIFENISRQIECIDDKELSEKFFSKLAKIGFSPDEEYRKIKLKAQSPIFYLVNKDFPKIEERDIKRDEIAKISYELIVKMIEKFRSEEWKPSNNLDKIK